MSSKVATVVPAVDTQFTKRAVIGSFLLHALIMALKISFTPLRVEERKDAIQVTMVSKEVLEKNKALKVKSEIKEVIKPVEKPKEKVIAGTEKVVPKAKELGNPKAKTVEKVQKGDPMSKNMTKYVPGTDVQKTRTVTIGDGSVGKSLTEGPAGGSGDTYKGLDFSTKSLSNNAPLGKRFAIKNAADDMGAGAGSSGGVGNGTGKGIGSGVITGSPNGTLEKAKILTNVGSLTGATVGKISSSRGAEGLGKKGTILLSGIPEETVVLGSMDPNVIRQILMQYLAQFRYCYQNELDRSDREDISGILQLNFNIGASGNVTKTNVTGPNNISPEIKSCVAGVLKGIEFPAPRGGGVVEVKQPLNLYPRKGY